MTGEISGAEGDKEDRKYSDYDEEWPKPTEIGEWMEVVETVFIRPFKEETRPTVELGSENKELDFFHTYSLKIYMEN